MKKMRLLSVFALVLSTMLYAADTAKPTLTQAQKREAVLLVRNVATAEFTYRNQSGGKFGTVRDLVNAGLVKVDNPDEPLPGFKLRVVVPGGDASKFQLSLIHGTTFWGLFTDENALIYLGEAMQ